ncbi:hypothetical protein [Oleidesulfovibrio sp.]|uniref:hypothetical protein n=1 Tax=Oleidesulfovibrio sp. TaxID=2909707 RepID=UPI003A8B5565
MECPRKDCGGETAVITTVATHDRIDRTRRCKRCGHRFTTTEIHNAAIMQVLERLSAGGQQGKVG